MPIAPIKFLLVDDLEANLLALEGLLKRQGLELLKARSGSEALELLLVHDIALALVDVQMPEMDGFELAELMRGAERTRRVPIIFVTAGATTDQRRFRGYELGAVDFLLKPIDAHILKSKADVFFELASQRNDLKQIAEDNARLLKERTASEQRLRSLFVNNIDGIFSLDLDGRFTDANPAALEFCGYTLEELRERTFADICAPERVKEAVQAFAQALNGDIQPLETVVMRKDGGRRELLIHGAPMVVNGERQGLYGVAVDITERKRAQAELERAKAEAERANRAKDQFLAALSHELRTPLTPVLLAVQVLEHDRSLPETVRADLAMVRRNVQIENRLIDDLLDLTRITQGKLHLHEGPVNIHAVLRDALETCFDDTAIQKRLRLRDEFAAADAMVWGDAARLGQVFWNLISNAVKFTPREGTITLRTYNPAPGVVAVRLADTGIGIEPEVLPHIFNSFEQGGEHVGKQFGGLGLGLAISRRLTEMHGGRVAARSSGRGRGAEFLVELPAMAHDDERLRGVRSTRGLEAVELKSSRAGRILLIEDHQHTARILTRLLARMGHEIRHAATAKEALNLASTQPFDLVISDIGLPDGSGNDVMRELRGRHGLRGIALSGFGMEEDIQRSRDAGFEDYFVKPIDFHHLSKRIRQFFAETTPQAGVDGNEPAEQAGAS